MTVSEITVDYFADYLRLEDDEINHQELQSMLDAAKSFIQNYTNIDNLDDYPEFAIAVVVIAADFYDNRQMQLVSAGIYKPNKTIECILDMHMKNKIG